VFGALTPRRAPHTLEKRRSTPRVVHSDLDVKSWAKAPPSVAAARPSRCPCCGLLGAPLSAPIGLHGHGLRTRLLLGPLGPGAPPQLGELMVRRYQCQRCAAVVVVCPRALRRYFRYAAVAIALALSMWSADGQPAAMVRAQVSPFRVVGHEARRDWRSLRRWARAGPRLWPQLRAGPDASPHAMAHGLVRQLAALATLPSGVMRVDACAGALGR